MAVEVSALGIGGEESGVLLGGHIEVLIDRSTLSKFQFQHLLFRSIADAGDTAGVYRNSLHAFLDADEPSKDRGRQLLLSSSGQQLLDAVDRIVRDAHQQLSQIGFGIETVSLAEPSGCTSPLRVLRQRLIREVPDHKPDTKAAHAISGGKIRNLQKACESSILSVRSMFCSGVELSSPTSICVITSWCGMAYCNTSIHCAPKTAKIRVTPTSKTLAQQQDGRRRGPAFRHRREPLPA